MSGKIVTNVRELRDPNALPRRLRQIAERITMGADSRDVIEHAADELEKHQRSNMATKCQ